MCARKNRLKQSCFLSRFFQTAISFFVVHTLSFQVTLTFVLETHEVGVGEEVGVRVEVRVRMRVREGVRVRMRVREVVGVGVGDGLKVGEANADVTGWLTNIP